MGNTENTVIKKVYSELKNSQKLDVVIFDNSSSTGIWKTKFNDAYKEFNILSNDGSIKLTNQQLLQTKMYILNKEWAQYLIDERYTIQDMGDFNNIGFSAFYSMEKSVFFK